MGAAARTARRPVTARTTRCCGWRAAGSAVRDVAHVFLRFIGAARHGILRLVVRVLPPIGPFARRLAALLRPLPGALARLLVAFIPLVCYLVRLLATVHAQLRAGLRGEQHAEARAQHGARQQPHHEASAAAAFIFETIVPVCHVASSS